MSRRTRARVVADGSIDVGGTTYRLVELGRRRYGLERQSDAAWIGGFELSPAGVEPLCLEAPDSASREVVRAVARLMGEPRGLLPLQ